MIDIDTTAIAAAIGGLEQYAKNCHQASLAIVRSGLLPEGSRVARGFRMGITSQHSWAVTGCPYDPKSKIIDATAWSYEDRDPAIDVVQGGSDKDIYWPHGSGSIWEYGRPDIPIGEVITLDVEWSKEAQNFLNLVGNMDRRGWNVLAHAPVGGWPAKEIMTAMYQDDRLQQLLPIDVVGMVTDLNPSELYW